MSWKPQVFIQSENKWCGNALVFETREEAEQNASDLLMRWFVPTDSRAIESTDPVNYRYVDHTLRAVAVDKEITKDKSISASEAKAIHRLLNGRH